MLNRPPSVRRVLMTADCVGGVWTYATTLCRGLAASGVDVLLAVTGGELGGREVDVPAGVRLEHRPLRCEWADPPLADVDEAGRWLDGLARDFDPDVVHLNDYAHGGRDFGRALRLVVAHSDVLSWFVAVENREAPAAWDAYRDAVSAGLRGAHVVVAPTQAVLDDLRRHYTFPVAGVVVPNAITPQGVPGASRKPFVLTAGRLWDKAKGVDVLCDAAARLPWPVRVAGEAGGALPGVVSLGRLTPNGVAAEMSVAGVYVSPARYEPFGLANLEAALAGCPLVLGDIPSLREVWGDAAVYVEPDPDAVADAVNTLIRDDVRRAGVAGACRRRAAGYTVARQVDAYLRLYAAR